MDEILWRAERSRLRALLAAHPTWSYRQYATALGRSKDWARTWCQRLRAAPPGDLTVLASRSRAAPRQLPFAPLIYEKVLAIRDHPPQNLQRTPGPRTILYYLAHDAEIAAAGLRVPTSSRTVWRILRAAGRIAPAARPHPEPLDLQAPGETYQIDFKDASSVGPDPEGKQQHVVEVLNVVDAGTSILVGAEAADDYRAATILPRLVAIVARFGLPTRLSCDRDPRFVGSPTGRDFPSPFIRFWLCLGVEVVVCPPRQPQKNCYVERYHRSYTEECLRVHRPADLATVREVTAAYREHYNKERPNQARSCGNRPPCVACAEFPARPVLPFIVDADRWLAHIDGQTFVRKVGADGCVSVDDQAYYVGQAYRGRRVGLEVAAAQHAFVVHDESHVLLTLPIKGLQHRLFTLEDFVTFTCAEAQRRDERAARAS